MVGDGRLRAAMLAILLCLVLPGAGLAADAPASTTQLPHLAAKLAHRAPLTIIAFGSSSTAGLGASAPDRTYPAQLEADLDVLVPAGQTVRVINRGVSGEDSDAMLARLGRDVLSAHPDLVIWQTGTNDALHALPLRRFEAETREGIGRMRAAGIDVVLMEPQDSRMMRATAHAAFYREAVRRIGQALGVPVVRRYDLIQSWIAGGISTEAALMAPDGLHMGDEGYARLAAEVARELLAEAGYRPTSATAARR